MSEIPCKKCTSPDCRGCNLLELSEALSDGRLNHYMDGNRRIHVPKRITLDASKLKAFSVDKTPGIEYDNIISARELYKEMYSWRDDVMRIARQVQREFDGYRETEIINHFEIDLSELREFINKKQLEKLGRLGKKTHFDEIKGMSEEELAWELCRIIRMPFYKDDSEIDAYEVDCWAKWLKQEANPNE